MSVTLSSVAAERVKEFLGTKGGGIGLRVGVKPNGCSGYAYVLDLANNLVQGDHVYESHGIKVIVDAESLPIIDGTRIDYIKQGLNESFSYENPNVAHECGCGESFGIE